MSEAVRNEVLVEKLLVTFALISYNQEKYIREAINGAFAQTYKPLEIILSDDCSADRTFDIMKEMVENYRGQHFIKLNSNRNNLGISDHVRLIHEMSSGDIVVHAAGDDISLPNRTQKIVEAFKSSNQAPSLVTSNVLYINEQGVPYEFQPIRVNDIVMEDHGNPLKVSTPTNGCAIAIQRRLITSFPPPEKGMIAEDVILERRAMLLNGKMFIPEVLVKYRVCGEGAFSYRTKSRSAYLEHLSRWQLDDESRLNQLELDVKHLGFSLEKFKSDINSYKKYLFKRNAIIHNSFFESTYALTYLLLFSESIMSAKTNLFNFLLRWFPAVVSYKK